MLLKTYHKAIKLFQDHQGYMNFEDLRNEKITITQIEEMEEEGIIEKFSTEWYWCNHCGFEKAKYYKYIELAKINPNAIICMDSACYLHGILEKEPKVVAVATHRNDRRKIEINFPIRRFYLKNTGMDDEIQTILSVFGEYKRYSLDRSICDCIRMKEKLDSNRYMEILNIYKENKCNVERLQDFGKALRNLKGVNEALFNLPSK